MQTSSFHTYDPSAHILPAGTTTVLAANTGCAGLQAGRARSRDFSTLNLLLALFASLALLSGAGCAKIGEPHPPEVRVPKAATDLAARQVSDFIVLTFSKPDRNTNGSEATTLKSVDIFRLSEETTGKDKGALPDEQFAKGSVFQNTGQSIME